MKINSCYKSGVFHVGRTNAWGSYCPETGEYYLACEGGMLASGCYWPDRKWQEQQYCGYNYEVVRELLQLGHLTSKTLKTFIEEGGSVWWNQSNYSEIDIMDSYAELYNSGRPDEYAI